MIDKSPDYWQNKLSLWLHDPVCKIFDIPNHEKTASEIAELLYQSIPKKDNYQIADCIASSLTRSLLPSHKDGGSVDFKEDTKVVHPLVKSTLNVKLPEVDIDELCKEIKKLLTEDLGLDKSWDETRNLPDREKPLNACFNYKDSPEEWAKALYNYLFFCFQRRLRTENIGNLGAVWDILPADTRMPDHPLWHHLGLVSAIGSSMGEDTENQIDMVVFSITPVQDFIAKARKLRDYWTGSVLLSYMTFAGITTVMDNLGPDHVVYPSLHNQPLVDAYIKENYRIDGKFLQEKGTLKDLLENTKGIAAFPNKFIFLCPHDKVKDFTAEISEAIQNKWIEISSGVKEYIEQKTGAGGKFSEIWNIQIEDCWKISWASAKLASLSDKETLKKLVSGKIVETEYDLLKDFSRSFNSGTARLYTSTHSLVQSVLAAGKTKPGKSRRPQYGEKCPLCGEREILNDFSNAGETSAKEYIKSVNDFWNKIRTGNNFRENEKLCAVCTIKRLLPVMSGNYNQDYILKEVFKSQDKFPSTTEMAAKRYIKRLKAKGISKGDLEKITEFLHNQDNFIDDTTDIEQLLKESGEKFTDRDKYYAVLLMDGDKMGDLINGETINATWKDVLYDNLAQKIENGTVKADVLKKHFSEKRSLNPALHAMISDSLNNFARFGVQPAVEKAEGKLIYAGGDDVCAVLPLDKALDCAEKIAEAYTISFAEYKEEGAVPIDKVDSSMQKIGYHLGHGADGISLSGAIVIAHHKESLRDVIHDAHNVLDSVAKEKTGRNAVAVRLKKRSGGDRDFACKWDALNIFNPGKRVLESFINICKAAGKGEISSSLLYKLKDMEQFFSPVINDIEGNKDYILRMLKYEIDHSGAKKSGNLDELTEDLAGICFSSKNYNFDAAIIANFMGSLDKGGDKK